MNKREISKNLKKEDIRKFVDFYIQMHHFSPSMNEIAKAVGINKTTAWRYLKEMDEDHFLHYDGDAIYTTATEKVAMEQVVIPVAGVIPCGSPQQQEEFINTYYSFPREIVGHGDFFILIASGDSMIDAGINHGDMVIIRRMKEARDGQIVAALTEEGCSTLKTYVEGDVDTPPHLHPENQMAGYPDIFSHFIIQGVAVKVIKDI